MLVPPVSIFVPDVPMLLVSFEFPGNVLILDATNGMLSIFSMIESATIGTNTSLVFTLGPGGVTGGSIFGVTGGTIYGGSTLSANVSGILIIGLSDEEK